MAVFSLSRRIYPPACKPYGLEAGLEAEPEAPISKSGLYYNPQNTSMYSCDYNFRFPRDKLEIFDLISGKISHSQTTSYKDIAN